MEQTGGLPLEMAGQCCHRVTPMLTGDCCDCLTSPGSDQADFVPKLNHKGSHEVNALLWGDPHKWLSTFQITQYQGLLYENPYVTTELCQAQNLATLLPVGEGGPSHKGGEILEEVYSSRPDLRDQPIPDPDWVLYTDGTNLVKRGQQLLGYPVVTEETIVEAGSLPSLVCSVGRIMGSNLGPPVVKR